MTTQEQITQLQNDMNKYVDGKMDEQRANMNNEMYANIGIAVNAQVDDKMAEHFVSWSAKMQEDTDNLVQMKIEEMEQKLIDEMNVKTKENGYETCETHVCFVCSARTGSAFVLNNCC